MKSEALEELRSISRGSGVEYLIESWIQRHVTCVNNSLSVTHELKEHVKDMDYLKYESEKQLRELAVCLIKNYCITEVIPTKFGETTYKTIFVLKD